MTVTEYWHELVTVALLGTDRRDAPAPPPGPVADTVADAVREASSTRMLAAVAATTVARRSGLRPSAPAVALVGPPADDRPMITPPAARRWREIVATWPVLEDEWLLVAAGRGWRPSPDVLVGLLARHRRDPARRAVVVDFAGPAAAWLMEHQPQLALPTTRSGAAPPVPRRLDELPGLAVEPTLASLLTAGAAAVAGAWRDGLRAGAFTTAHHHVLANFVARCRTDVLADLAAFLAAFDGAGSTGGLAHSMAELASTRHHALIELER